MKWSIYNNKFFNFNSKTINEAIELDDEEDDIQQPTFQKNQYTGDIDINTFKKIYIDGIILKSVNAKNEGCEYYEYTNKNDGLKHYIFYFQNAGRMFIDYNIKTRELIFGKFNDFGSSRWLNISYSLIQMISSWNGPIYYGDSGAYGSRIGDFRDFSYYRNDNQKSIASLDFYDISESCSFFRDNINGKSLYLPNTKQRYKKIKDNWPDDLKIPHSFMQNLQGILSKHAPLTPGVEPEDNMYTWIYQEMFESKEDFEKMVKILSEANYPVYDGTTNTYYTPDNYLDLLSDNGNNDTTKVLSAEDQQYRDKLVNLLGESTVINFEKIIKRNRSFNVKDLYNVETTSRNAYCKFSNPLVKKILTDNNISFENILHQSHIRVVNAFKEIVNICAKKDYSPTDEIKFIFNDYLRYYTPTIDPELDEAKNKLKNEIYIIEDYKKAGAYLDNYYKSCGGSLEHENLRLAVLYYDQDGVPRKINKPEDKLILRFYYILSQMCSKDMLEQLQDQPDTKTNQIKKQLCDNILKSGFTILSDTYVEYGYNKARIFNISDMVYDINSYESLYKFCYYIAYAVNNAYNNIQILNFSMYKKSEINLDEQFTNDKPDMSTFNSTSLANGLNTIFMNIANKI